MQKIFYVKTFAQKYKFSDKYHLGISKQNYRPLFTNIFNPKMVIPDTDSILNARLNNSHIMCYYVCRLGEEEKIIENLDSSQIHYILKH
jgi:hypothetical protein